MSNLFKRYFTFSRAQYIMYRRAFFIGIGAYLMMLVLAVVFYKERIIFLDTADTLFYLVKNGSFSLYASRCAVVVTQIFPLLAVKAGLSLAAITLSYSLGFVIFYFACYLVCGLVLRQYALALTLLLFHILFITDTFYYIPSELPQGINLMVVVFAMMFYKQQGNRLSAIPIYICAFAMAFFHPLVLFTFAFAFLFFLLHSQSATDRKLLITVAAIYISGVVINNLFFRIPYDRASMSGMKNFISQFPDYFTIYSNKRFLYNCKEKYYWIPILFFGTALFYGFGREWKKLSFFVVSVIGYLVLVNVSYPFPTTQVFYMENLYLPLGIFLAIPFVFDLAPALEKRRLAVPLLALMILTAAGRFYTTQPAYAHRLNWERNYLEKYQDTKVIAHAKNANAGILLMLWGTPYEFWLLSTIEKGKTASIIIDDNPPHRAWAANLNKTFVVNWNMFAYKDLNPKYFILSDTVNGYLIER